MITAQEIEKLRSIRAPQASVLSLYLPVPLDPAGLRGLPALAGDLIDAAGAAASQRGAATRVAADREAVRALVETGQREWLGHTVAIFACAQLGLLEAMPLPGPLTGLGVISTRPYVRPLLMAVERSPGYLVVIVDRQHAWLFSVTGDTVETIARRKAPAVRSPGYGGWYGLQAHRVQQRAIQLARRHYRDVAVILGSQALAGDFPPLVIGGHEESIGQLLRVLPPRARQAYAGSFTADPQSMPAAVARDLADQVIDRWAIRRERKMTAAVLDAAASGRGAIGLPGCLTAVNAGAADLLLLPETGMVPGFGCDRCGRLMLAGEDCPDQGAAARPVPDLLEEMAAAVLGHGGQVVTIRTAPFSVAVRLRYPVNPELPRQSRVRPS
jgi:Bacterial archaeo-eukaryotic release factor family 10